MIQADILVVLATFNGRDRLARVLDGYINQIETNQTWKIVVADNGSTDNTAESLEIYKSKLDLYVLTEKNPGKNIALNCAMREISAKLYVFTDDDAIPAPDFIAQWSKCLSDYHEFDVFGGTVIPLFDSERPDWLDPDALPFDILYAQNIRKDGAIAPSSIFGPNMAVRGAIFNGDRWFDENIGPNSTDKTDAMGSETEFCVRICNEGAKSYFLGSPIVHHIVRPDQMTRDFVFARARRMGRGYARMLHDPLDKPKVDLPVLRYLPHHIRQLFRFAGLTFASGAQKIRKQWNFNIEKGYHDHVKELYGRF
jgi:glycosyltransferase involved in cell wall biosynthesis